MLGLVLRRNEEISGSKERRKRESERERGTKRLGKGVKVGVWGAFLLMLLKNLWHQERHHLVL